MAYRGLSHLQALTLVRARRPVAYPNLGFAESLVSLEAELRPHEAPSITLTAVRALHRGAPGARGALRQRARDPSGGGASRSAALPRADATPARSGGGSGEQAPRR